jgi:hypothetical protein|tara:strand:+ start:1210 stop:1800 length:591 start_codon:yes stop_codon:yes gene_type:complete
MAREARLLRDRNRRLAAKEEKRLDALHSRDAPKYASRCNGLGLSEEHIEDLDLYREGIRIIEINTQKGKEIARNIAIRRNMESQYHMAGSGLERRTKKANFAIPNRKILQSYARLLHEATSNDFFPGSVPEDRPAEKIELLEEYGLVDEEGRVKIPGGRKVELSKYQGTSRGKLFEKCCNGAATVLRKARQADEEK